MDFTDIPSTGQDDIERRKLVENAVKARRWSLIPQLIAGAGDALSVRNQAYGVHGPTGTVNKIQDQLEGRITDTSKQFESTLTTNPASDVSKQYQNLLSRFLKKDPREFSKMSAAQIKDQIPAIEKLSQMENQRAMKDMTMQGQADARKDAAENRRLQFEALQQNRQSLNEDRDLKRQLQEQQSKEGKVQRYSETINKEQIPELVTSYNRLFPKMTSGKDIPGVGVFASHIPNLLVSAEGKSVRQDLQKIANVVLKRRSGAAVTDPEYNRFLTELQAGKMPTEEALKLYYDKLGQDMTATLGQLESGLPTDALQEYSSRSGAVTSQDILRNEQLKAESAGAVPTVGSTFQGGKVLKVTRIK